LDEINIAMINDCSFVGENIIKYLPSEFKVHHCRRSRGFFDKTFGVLGRVYKAKGDVFHVHFALQDAYLTCRFKKKKQVIVHAHGSDVRSTIRSKKWGWMTRYSIEHATRLLVSAPDVLEKARQLRPDVIYIPIPVDLAQFTVKQPVEHDKVVLFHPYLNESRGTQVVIHAFSFLQKKHPEKFMLRLLGKPDNYVRWLLQNLNLKDVELIESVEHEKMVSLYQQADVIISDMRYGAMPTTSIEAMACGKPLVQYIKPAVYGDEIEFPPVFAVKETTPVALFDVLDQFVNDVPRSSEYRRYVEKNHNAKRVAKTIGTIYHEVVPYSCKDEVKIITMEPEEVKFIES